MDVHHVRHYFTPPPPSSFSLYSLYFPPFLCFVFFVHLFFLFLLLLFICRFWDEVAYKVVDSASVNNGKNFTFDITPHYFILNTAVGGISPLTLLLSPSSLSFLSLSLSSLSSPLSHSPPLTFPPLFPLSLSPLSLPPLSLSSSHLPPSLSSLSLSLSSPSPSLPPPPFSSFLSLCFGKETEKKLKKILGSWPGDPDNTTVWPQYHRIFFLRNNFLCLFFRKNKLLFLVKGKKCMGVLYEPFAVYFNLLLICIKKLILKKYLKRK
jgi:hypothetical protein